MTRQVLVTGASSDIGIAVCRLYLANNYRVLGLYNKGQSSLIQLAEQASNLTLHQLNFETPENIEQFINENQEQVLDSDVVIHAAAFVQPVSFFDITTTDLLNTFTINVISSFLFTRSIVPVMIDKGWGRIVNLSSIGVKFGGGAKTFCYSLSKHALEFFPQEHRSWSASNVLINSLRVGVTDTRIHKIDPNKDMSQRVSMIPMGRMATPEEMANTVYWLGSDQNAFMTGQVITVAGGE